MELVRRQPDVVFPPKIGSGPLETLTVRQLRAALAGPHGYVASPAALAATPDIVNDNGDSLSPLPSPLILVCSEFTHISVLMSHNPEDCRNPRARSEPLDDISEFQVILTFR